ncbi:hypothetical protein IMG5_183240 [Ichthyophthirius multifiliis]|uniref:Uncharacterized protein n=1 Tax=Ichthyophthirius multifiliis TaxID=5932 RepID=G0R353_ICHMU|nr:hypothetical protein IMG5_183240 [Ichthyophthirius multifiliis]EGR28102.1 hypothetical protein IMG5_183240 [Ichthyophthirius multifiliis]|eukprot:XP_004027447.1 hypothetical protein IMG5_183240 [Ichthyophthirius multifiliis]
MIPKIPTQHPSPIGKATSHPNSSNRGTMGIKYIPISILQIKTKYIFEEQSDKWKNRRDIAPNMIYIDIYSLYFLYLFDKYPPIMEPKIPPIGNAHSIIVECWPSKPNGDIQQPTEVAKPHIEPTINAYQPDIRRQFLFFIKC